MQSEVHETNAPASGSCDERTTRADTKDYHRRKHHGKHRPGMRKRIRGFEVGHLRPRKHCNIRRTLMKQITSSDTASVRPKRTQAKPIESEAPPPSAHTRSEDSNSGGGALHERNDPSEPNAEPPTAARQEPTLAHPRTAGVPSPRIPQELIDRVISFLWDWPPVLDTCNLVSRACYSYVTTFSGILKLGSASSFSVLSKSPTAAEKLRDVHCLILRDSATPWLHRVPLLLGPALADVTELRLINWSPARTLHTAVLPAFAHLRSVTKLTLYDCRFESVAQLQRLLGAFPGLRVLMLLGVYVPAHKASAEGASSVVCRPPPRLTHLALSNSTIKKPETGEANIAGALAVWFTKDQKRLQELQILSIWLMDSYLREGEAASIGQLVTAVGPHISNLDLYFDAEKSDSSDDVTDCLKLDSCMNVQDLQLIRGSPELNELALLSPDCRIKALFLASDPWHTERPATDWAALTTTLEGSAYNDLEVVYNASRIPQSPAEAKLQKAFIARMHARGIEYEDCTKFPYLLDGC